MQHLRTPLGITLRGLAEEIHSEGTAQWGGVTAEMDVLLDGERLGVRFGSHEVPMTSDGLEQLATFVGAPRSFVQKLPVDLQQTVLARLLRDTSSNVTVRYGDSGINEMFQPGRVRLEPRQVVDSAIKVMGEQALVVERYYDSDDLLLDVMVPEDFDRGIGGDPAVGDISRGGIRVTQDRKNNHAPKVNSYIYRLACTNGMVVPDTGLTLDARGSSAEILLAELELAAQHAFGQVEEQIRHFYELRNQRIEGDVTQTVIRVAAERGLPDRTGLALARRVPDQLNPETLGREATMFDLVNLITNQANDPALSNRPGSRRALEMAGGSVVRQVHDRCGSCYQVVA